MPNDDTCREVTVDRRGLHVVCANANTSHVLQRTAADPGFPYHCACPRRLPGPCVGLPAALHWAECGVWSTPPRPSAMRQPRRPRRIVCLPRQTVVQPHHRPCRSARRRWGLLCSTPHLALGRQRVCAPPFVDIAAWPRIEPHAHYGRPSVRRGSSCLAGGMLAHDMCQPGAADVARRVVAALGRGGR